MPELRLPRAMPSTSSPIQLPLMVRLETSFAEMPLLNRTRHRPRTVLPLAGEAAKGLAVVNFKPSAEVSRHLKPSSRMR